MLPRRLRYLLATLALFPSALVPAQTQDAPTTGTARDLITKADAAYNSKRYDEAASGYRRYLDDFGSNPEAAPDLPGVHYNLAAALMQKQDFARAADAAEVALGDKERTEAQREDLIFWRGAALLQCGDPERALVALDEFRSKYPRSAKSADGQLLAASALLQAGKLVEAASAFREIRLSPAHPHRARAIVLELHCLAETGNDDAALEVVSKESPRQAAEITQVAAFQLLALGLGERLLEAGRSRDAIRALQVVWPRDQLVAHQRRRLEENGEALAQADRQLRPDPCQRASLAQEQKEIQRELAQLEKMPSFDASTRFRLASAFQQQGRYRECALLLEDMLRQMQPDATVEKASLSALQSWMAIERYDRAIESSCLFEQRFPGSKSLPLALYLRGTAQQRLERYDAALETFAGLREKFPSSAEAPRAFFLRGFTQLLAERNDDAAATFGAFLKDHPAHELAEPAHYWRGSALAFAKKFPEARAVLAAHPAKFREGSLLGPAAFRLAYCAQATKDYALAETELKTYLAEYPGGEEANEARILLGDALLAQGKADEGKSAYAAIPAEAGRWNEDSYFKRAKILKLEEDHDGVRALLQEYLAAHPRSSRAAEALYLIGQSWRQQEHPEKAIEEYWRAIDQFGNDPEALAVEDLFVALGRHYKDEAQKLDHLAALRKLRDRAAEQHQTVLAARAVWALAQAVKGSDPVLHAALLRELSVTLKPELSNPRVLADCAEAEVLAAGSEPDPRAAAARKAKAGQLYRDMLKWHPRATQKDKALAALARISEEAGDSASARDYRARIERDVPWSPLVGEALMARAGEETRAGRYDAACETYTKLLGVQAVSGKLKAGALLALGEIEMLRDRPQTAIPYYQRIYVMYGRWGDAVAKAYLRSGEAFEQLKDVDAARRTYQELVSREELAGMPEAATARERLGRIGGAGERAS